MIISGTSIIVLVMRRPGFTLIEILVSIAVIAVFVAVLAPYLGRSRLQAKATKCALNIRQLSIALFTYASDESSFPYGFYSLSRPEGGYAGFQMQGYDRKGWWWFNYLEGLYKKGMGSQTVLQCPSKNLQDFKFKNDLKDDILCGNYGVNLSICKMFPGKENQLEFVGEPLAGLEVRYPSRTLLLLDSGYAIISWRHAADIPPSPLGNSMIEDTAYIPGLKINKDRLLLPGGGQTYDALFGRHPNKKVNVGFSDNHVSLTRADDLLVEKKPEGYKNLVPLWRPN